MATTFRSSREDVVSYMKIHEEELQELQSGASTSRRKDEQRAVSEKAETEKVAGMSWKGSDVGNAEQAFGGTRIREEDVKQPQQPLTPLDDIKVGLGVLESSYQNRAERPVKPLVLDKVPQEPLPTAAQSNRLRIQDNTLFKLKQLFRQKLVSERDQLSQCTNQRSSLPDDYQILPKQVLVDAVKEQRPSYNARFKVQLKETLREVESEMVSPVR